VHDYRDNGHASLPRRVTQKHGSWLRCTANVASSFLLLACRRRRVSERVCESGTALTAQRSAGQTASKLAGSLRVRLQLAMLRPRSVLNPALEVELHDLHSGSIGDVGSHHDYRLHSPVGDEAARTTQLSPVPRNRLSIDVDAAVAPLPPAVRIRSSRQWARASGTLKRDSASTESVSVFVWI